MDKSPIEPFLMIAEIRNLPRREWEGQATHDPIPDLVPEGITLKGKIDRR
jgi:hypothetical protein